MHSKLSTCAECSEMLGMWTKVSSHRNWDYSIFPRARRIRSTLAQ